MRHPERELKTRETITAMLERSLVGRIATVNQKGFPVIKPVNFVYLDGRIYFHSSAKGEKIDLCGHPHYRFDRERNSRIYSDLPLPQCLLLPFRYRLEDRAKLSPGHTS